MVSPRPCLSLAQESLGVTCPSVCRVEKACARTPPAPRGGAGISVVGGLRPSLPHAPVLTPLDDLEPKATASDPVSSVRSGPRPEEDRADVAVWGPRQVALVQPLSCPGGRGERGVVSPPELSPSTSDRGGGGPESPAVKQSYEIRRDWRLRVRILGSQSRQGSILFARILQRGTYSVSHFLLAKQRGLLRPCPRSRDPAPGCGQPGDPMDITLRLGNLHPKRSQCLHRSSPRDVSRGHSREAKAVRKNTDILLSLQSSPIALSTEEISPSP